MLQRTEGLVLKTTPLGEADLIVTFLTKDFGVAKAFAKSPRKTKSRFGSSLEPLTHSRISFWGKEDAALPRLTQSDILHPFHPLRSELKTFLSVCEMAELTLGFLPERDPTRNVFALFLETLRTIEGGGQVELLKTFYSLKLLEAAGYLPRLTGCGKCGGKGGTFYLSQGTVLCPRCSGGAGTRYDVSPGALRLSETLMVWELKKIGRIKPAASMLSELSRIIGEHVAYILEKRLRTTSFRLP